MIHIMDRRRSGQLKHYEWKTNIPHLLYWLLVRNRWGTLYVYPLLFYSLWSHLLPWFLFSLVSSCLFRRGGGKAAAAQSESVQFKCRTKAMSPRLCSGYAASPAVLHLQQVSTPSLAWWPHLTQLGSVCAVMGARGACCHGNLRVLSREEIVQKKIRLRRSIRLLSPPSLHIWLSTLLSPGLSLSLFHTHSNSLHILIYSSIYILI